MLILQNKMSSSSSDLSKISQLEAYTSVYKHDFICISKTLFDASVQERDKNIQLNGCNLLRANHPSNSKRGGKCIFYKETLVVCMVKSSSLSECVICQVSIQNSKGYVGVVYGSGFSKHFLPPVNSNLKL